MTVFYSPEYQYEAGSVWTTEASFTQVFPKFSAIHREWTPSFSALLGWQKATSDKAVYINNVTGDDNSYLYWNAGVSLRLPREVVDRLPLLGHEHRQAARLRQLQHRSLLLRPAVRSDPEVHVLIRVNGAMLRAPVSGALFFWCEPGL